MNVKQKIGTAVATAAMMMGVLVPGVFASGTGVSGNGAFSSNFISNFNFLESLMRQNSSTTANTSIQSNATSGGNSDSFNTGGWNLWGTSSGGGSSWMGNGSASSNVGVSIKGGGNNLTSMGCGCGSSGNGVTVVSGNGAFSQNSVFNANLEKFRITQASAVLANTQVTSNATSGSNTASFNTGSTINQTSGSASSNVGVAVQGGDNNATVENCGCTGNDATTIVAGNGAFSENGVHSINVNTNTVDQSSQTTANTTVQSNATSGGNTANFNTGGSTSQSTGSTLSNVGVIVSGGGNMLLN